MQNYMVGGWGNGCWGKNKNEDLGKKGKEKRGEIT